MAAELEGVELIERRLAGMPGVIGRKYLGAAMRAAAQPLESELLVTTPIGPTGALRRAVDASVRVYASGVAFGVVGYKRTSGGGSADGRAYHAHLIEFGTNERTPKKAPVLSSYRMAGSRPPGWTGRWPMVARRVRGSRALHPLSRAFESVGRRCSAILAAELATAFERAATESGGGS